MRPSDYDLLKKTALYASIGEDGAQRLVRGAFVQGLPKGAVLFNQGDEAEFVHIVLSGRVALVADAPDAHPTVIEFLPPGEIFVAPAAMLKLPYLMSARVIADSRILMIPAETFRRAVASELALACAVAEALAKHWRVLIRQIKDLKLRSASERLAAYLLTQAPQRNGSVMVKLSEERQLLAARLGMTPESLSRAFVQLKPLGVSAIGRQIHIANLDQLRVHCRFEDVR
jgi:CRP/FNR family transcriptional regulator, transcriptional activator FtrB